MPYSIIKLPGKKNSYQVINRITGKVHAYDTTLQKAKSQIRLMEMLDAHKKI